MVRSPWRMVTAVAVVVVVVLLVVLFPWMVRRLPEQAREYTSRRARARESSALSNMEQVAPAMQAFVGKSGEYNADAEVAFQNQAANMYAMNAPGAAPTGGRVTVPAGYPLQAPRETDVDLDLTVNYKKQDEVYLTTYDAVFTGDYIFENPDPKNESKIVLTFPFPPNVNTLSDLTLTVDGKEADNTRVSMHGITWAGWFEPEESKKIHVGYAAQGIDDFSYAVDHERLNPYFRLVAVVHGVDDVALPNDCLRLQEKEDKDGALELTWFHKDLITSRDIMIDLPDREPELTFAARLQKYADRFTVLCRVAPLFGVMFLGATMLSAWVGAPKLTRESHVLLVLNFLLFYPFIIFTSGFTGVTVAFWIGAVLITVINGLYAWRAAGFGMLWRTLLFTAVFLGLFSFAVLHERLTGLLISVGGVIIVGFFMLSHSLWPPPKKELPPPIVEPEDLEPAPIPVDSVLAIEGGYCAHCGATMGEGFKFCPQCARQAHEVTRCANCGAETCAACGTEFGHCPKCGTKS